ncbi:MAG TPA: alpha/beta hydrolase [Xanthomonadales bacterium]|nr:alpha/beta hydrolase [Xanthomonadales bacterium]
MSTLRRRIIGGVVAVVAVLAISVAVSWQPDRPVEDLSERWAARPSQWMALDGDRIHWRDEGRRDDPLPLLLLHGTSASLHTWDGWVRALAPERRVIRLDLPGFGLTGPASDGDYRLTRYVERVTRLLDQLRVPRAVLIGNSLGGQIAWATAVVHPDRVAGLVLIDAAGYPFVPESIPIGFQLARSPLLAPLVQKLLPRAIVAASVRDTYGNPDRVSADVIDRYFELTLRAGNRQAVVARFAQTDYSEMSERIRDVRAPTLILWGGKDRLIPPANGERFHADIQGSELVVFPDLGHVPQEEDAAQTVTAARRFLAARACAGCAASAQAPQATLPAQQDR